MKLLIERDEFASSPSEWGDDNLFIVANHRQFYVPVPGEKRITEDAEELVKRFKRTHWAFLVEAYIHGGVVLALAGERDFPDRRWDVSLVGYVFAAKKEWRMSKTARKAARGLIETWNQYLSGDVWMYIIEDDEGNTIDSCGGFYGEKECREEGEKLFKELSERPVPEKVDPNQLVLNLS